MPEAISTVTSTVRADPTAPKPAAPVAPAPVAEAPKPAEQADPVAKAMAELKAKEEALLQQQRKFRNELKKNAEEKAGLGAKLSEYEQLKKEKAEWAKEKAEREKQDRLNSLNPVAALEKQLGKDWVKKANELAATGVPPADIIAAGLQDIEDRLARKLEERDAQAKAAAEQEREQATLAQQREYQALKQSAAAEYADLYRQAPDAFPIFGFRKLSPEQVGQMVADRIEHVARTTGQELSYQQAAEAIEAEALELTEFAASAEKYKSRLQEKLKPATVPVSSGVQGVPGATSTTRRTLGNHLTASTSDRPPAKTPAEKLQRAREVYESVSAANLAKRQS